MPANLRCTFYCFVVLLFDYVMHLRSWCSKRTTNTSMMMMMMMMPHSVNPILIILFLALLNPILSARLSHHHHCHFPSLLLFSTLNSKGTFSLNPILPNPTIDPHPFHRTAFTDPGLLNCFLFSSFSINS